jgi:hypothetical protein
MHKKYRQQRRLIFVDLFRDLRGVEDNGFQAVWQIIVHLRPSDGNVVSRVQEAVNVINPGHLQARIKDFLIT